ncbi:hypothetical protein chiPu_0031577 [Chiloscyllium punctatum]|uniref:Uncharacterized protein n=1 Tax=Chiloscyllium punctatum TaxID=137246 RepID=A0A401TY59_CHIPU|nr:hypothetical protein [Chiloscyllium punctatum]
MLSCSDEVAVPDYLDLSVTEMEVADALTLELSRGAFPQADATVLLQGETPSLDPAARVSSVSGTEDTDDNVNDTYV